MSEATTVSIPSPNRILYSREFILQYSNRVREEPAIIDKLIPILSPPSKQSQTKKHLVSQRSPFGKKNWNGDQSEVTSPMRYGTDKMKAKTPNPRKVDVVPSVAAQSEKKQFGRVNKDAAFSQSPFKSKMALSDSQSNQKENLPINGQYISNNHGKPVRSSKNSVKLPPQELQNGENAMSPSSKGGLSARPVNNATPNRRQPTSPRPVFTKKIQSLEENSLHSSSESGFSPRSAPDQTSAFQMVVSEPAQTSVKTDEAPQTQDSHQTPVSSPLIKTSLARHTQTKSPVASTNQVVATASPFSSPQSKKWVPDANACPTTPKVSTVPMTPFKSPQSSLSPGKSPKSPNRPISPLDEQRLLQRQKQIDYGYRTVGYLRYRLLVAKEQRKPDHPRTPKKTQGCSKRSWDGQLKKWRRDLHLWDPDNMDAFRALLNADLVVGIISANPELEEIVRIVREKMDNPSNNAANEADGDDDDNFFSPVKSPLSPPSAAVAALSLLTSNIPPHLATTTSGDQTITPDGVNDKVSPSRIANDPRLHKVARTLVF